MNPRRRRAARARRRMRRLVERKRFYEAICAFFERRMRRLSELPDEIKIGRYRFAVDFDGYVMRVTARAWTRRIRCDVGFYDPRLP